MAAGDDAPDLVAEIVGDGAAGGVLRGTASGSCPADIPQCPAGAANPWRPTIDVPARDPAPVADLPVAALSITMVGCWAAIPTILGRVAGQPETRSY